MKNYFFDVDGVVRKFTESVMRSKAMDNLSMDKWIKLPNGLWEDLDKNTKKYLYDCDTFQDIVDFVKKLMVNGNGNIIFLTNQMGVKKREYWTLKFLKKHFGNDINVIFVSNFQEKIQLLKDNPKYSLVDDYPFFYEKKDFNDVKNQIIMVRRPWNWGYRKYYKKFLKDIMEI